jgi:hypothetical protein
MSTGDHDGCGPTGRHPGSTQQMEPELLKKGKKRLTRGERKARKRLKENVGNVGVGVPLYMASCHRMTSMPKVENVRSTSGNCAAITHAVYDTFQEKEQSLAAEKKTNKRTKTLQRKKIKMINALPKPITRPETIQEYQQLMEDNPVPKILKFKLSGRGWCLSKLPKWKVYVAGILEELLPKLPEFSVAWSVKQHFQIFENSSGTGCYLPEEYVLAPRKTIKAEFRDTTSFYDCVHKIIINNQGQDPRGQNKVPVYDDGAPKSYVCLGDRAKKFGSGTELIMKNLAGPKATDEMKVCCNILIKLFNKTTNISKTVLDGQSIRFAEFVKKATGFRAFGETPNNQSSFEHAIWPCVAMAENVTMEVHCDNDYLMGCVIVFGSDGFVEDDTILQYFCFLDSGTAIAMRNDIASLPEQPSSRMLSVSLSIATQH